MLAFDIRARDERERIAGVLDTRPIPNVVLLGGRVLGIVFIAWLPLVVWALSPPGPVWLYSPAVANRLRALSNGADKASR